MAMAQVYPGNLESPSSSWFPRSRMETQRNPAGGRMIAAPTQAHGSEPCPELELTREPHH